MHLTGDRYRNFPAGWPGTFMTGEEMFEELLNFKIMSEPK